VRPFALSVLFLAIFCQNACAASELTPEQRARVFGPPTSVSTSKAVARVPLEGTDRRGYYKCAYLHVSINGRGPFTFLFDTGASYTSISSEVIRAAHLPLELDRGGYHDLLRIASMKIGQVEIHDLTAVRDDDFGVDGVLGFRSFGDMNLTFDLRERVLLVSEQPVPLSGGFELPYELDHNIPVLPVTIDTTHVPILIDTGDDAYAFELRSDDLKGAVFTHPPIVAHSVLNGPNRQQTKFTTLETPVRLGPLAYQHAVVGINDDLPISDFGVAFLKDFRFELEPKRMVATFQPHFTGAAPPIRGNLSLGYVANDQGKVTSVVPGSAAEAHGMRAGDVILSVAGRKPGGYKPREWDELLAKHASIEVGWLQGQSKRVEHIQVTELR